MTGDREDCHCTGRQEGGGPAPRAHIFPWGDGLGAVAAFLRETQPALRTTPLAHVLHALF